MAVMRVCLWQFVDDGNTKLSKLLEPDRHSGAAVFPPDATDSGGTSGTPTRPTLSGVLLGTPSGGDGHPAKTNLIDDSSIEVGTTFFRQICL